MTATYEELETQFRAAYQCLPTHVLVEVFSQLDGRPGPGDYTSEEMKVRITIMSELETRGALTWDDDDNYHVAHPATEYRNYSIIPDTNDAGERVFDIFASGIFLVARRTCDEAKQWIDNAINESAYN